MSFLFWDPSDKKIKLWEVGKGGFPPSNARSVLVKSDDSGFLFESGGVFVNGAQYVAKVKISPGSDGKTFAWGWSKVSGAGVSNVGPITYKRMD